MTGVQRRSGGGAVVGMSHTAKVLALKVSVVHEEQVKYFHNRTEICLPYQ